MRIQNAKKIVLATVSAMLMASILVASPVVQNQDGIIGQDVSAVKATKIAKVTMQTTANLSLRSTASAKGKWLTSLPKGTKVSTDTKVGKWYKVSYKGKTGYVSGSFLKKVTATTSTPKANEKPAPKAAEVTKRTVVTTTGLNMRSTASSKGKWLAKIPKGKQITAGAKKNGWVNVRYGNKTGWVSGSYLKEVKVATKKPAPQKATAPAPEAKPVASETQRLMSRADAEAHISKYVTKSRYGYELKSGTGRFSIIVEFPSSNSGKAQMSVDGVNYVSGYSIKPEDFGQEAYEGTKEHYTHMNNAILAYAESQFGVGSKESKTLFEEVKQMTLFGNNGDVKHITLQGKSVRIAMEGVRTRVSY